MHKVPSIEEFKHTHYCKACSCLYGCNSANSSVCPACKSSYMVDYVMQSRKEKNPGVLIGVGSGGHQSGSDNHQFDETSALHRYRLDVKGYTSSHYKETARRLWGAKCVVCGDTRCIHIHHINGVKSENLPHNIVPLCERCHNGIHSIKRMSSEELLSRFLEIAPENVLERLECLKGLEGPDGTIPEHDLAYIGAEFIVKNGISPYGIVSGSRPNAKQEVLIHAMKNSSCKCAVCGRDDERLALTFINGNRLDRRPENLTMLCKQCYNAIMCKFKTYEAFIR